MLLKAVKECIKMKKYVILDTESTRDFANSLIGMIFEGELLEDNTFKLNTFDGELFFNDNEVAELDENYAKIYNYCEMILSETVSVNVNEKKNELYGFFRGIKDFVNIIRWDNLFNEYCIKINNKVREQKRWSIISYSIYTDVKDCNDENIYLYAVQVYNGNIVYFDTIDNTWEQGDKVNLTINNSGAVVGVEWLK